MKEIKKLKYINILVETKEANKKVAALEKQILDLKKTIEKTGKDSTKGFKGLTGALRKVAKGFKGVGLALKGAGIGLVLGLLASLKDLLNQNSTASIAFATAFEFIENNV